MRQIQLFAGQEIINLIGEHKTKLISEIESISREDIQNCDIKETCDYFIKKYEIKIPVILEGEIHYDITDCKVDVSKDPSRAIFDRSRPVYIDGTQYKLFIPFEGNEQVFHYRPRGVISPTSEIFVEITPSELVYSYYCVASNNLDINLQPHFDSVLHKIKEWLTRVGNEINSYFNGGLSSTVQSKITERRQKIAKDLDRAKGLKFPLKKRDDSDKINVATIKRKPSPLKRPEAQKPWELEQSQYEFILKVISDMTLVMERSPKAFAKMDEENLRDHFLVQLNGHYEGQATGETFNFEGKTDILIRVENRNVFIAECKFWHGKEMLLATIDQILGYLSWRDTKTAIVIFSKNKDFSSVIDQILPTIKTHSNYSKTIKKINDTSFQFEFSQKQDAAQKIILTVMAFNIPDN